MSEGLSAARVVSNPLVCFADSSPYTGEPLQVRCLVSQRGVHIKPEGLHREMPEDKKTPDVSVRCFVLFVVVIPPGRPDSANWRRW